MFSPLSHTQASIAQLLTTKPGMSQYSWAARTNLLSSTGKTSPSHHSRSSSHISSSSSWSPATLELGDSTPAIHLESPGHSTSQTPKTDEM